MAGIEQDALNLTEPVAARAANATDPDTGAGKGAVYWKEVSGESELFFKSSDGTVTQITEAGSVKGATGGGSGSVSDFEFLVDTGAPSTQGVDGNLYLDSATGIIYKKTSGTWNAEANISGPSGADGLDGADGADGSSILYGTAAPDDQDGQDGDTYVRTSNGALYEKASGTWVLRYTPSTGGGGSSLLEEIQIQLGSGATLADKINNAPTGGIPAGVTLIDGADASADAQFAGSAAADLIVVHNKNKFAVEARVVIKTSFPGIFQNSNVGSDPNTLQTNSSKSQTFIKNGVSSLASEAGTVFLQLISEV